jgi:HK97 gp10 family phage protein
MGATLTGAKELEKALKTLGERTQRKVTRQAVNAACTPILKAARANAPEESGLLKEAMAKKIVTYPEQMTIVGIIGPDTQTKGEFNGEPRWPAKYAHLVENGHINPQGEYVPPHPFLRPAYDSTEAQALGVMKEKMGKGIEREAAKQS